MKIEIAALACAIGLGFHSDDASAWSPLPRHVILFVGEGIGISTIAATRVRDGKLRRAADGGGEARLSFEAFPATAFVKTDSVHSPGARSAGSITTIMTGVTVRGVSIGMDDTVSRGQCEGTEAHVLASLLEQAKDAGLAAGIVTTSRITKTVPAATYAHVSDPDWEVDSRMPRYAFKEGCLDIARQLVEFEHRGGLDVVFGGGRLAFMTANEADPQDPARRGVREDGRNLITAWRSRNPSGLYVSTAAQLAAGLSDGQPRPILGLFAPDDLSFNADQVGGADKPSLADMTKAAITNLARSPRGYALVVDAGGVARAQASGDIDDRALTETIAFSQAVAAAVEMTKATDTLIVVTSDRGGEDFPIHARGPGSQRIHGVIEQDTLYWVMHDALGLPGAPK
jgi:alkaline phosphatase